MMPALQLAQERNGGWLSEQSFREVADALDLTPAYCLSIASFYDMFRLEPVGEHVIEVCTNISCGLKGAQQVVEAFEQRARPARRRDDRRVHAADGRVPRRLRLGDGRGCEQPAPAARERGRRARDRGGAAREPFRRPRRSGMATAPTELVFAGTDGGAVTKIADYEAVGRLHCAREGARDDARRGDRRAERVEPARPRWRLLPDGPQVELRAEARAAPEAALPRHQRRRVRAGHLQGPRDHAARPLPLPRGRSDRRARDRVEARLHLHPRRVRGGVRGARRRARADARAEAARGRHDRAPPRCRRLHLRRGDGAARVARGQARPAAHEAAVPRHRGPLRLADGGQQRRVDHVDDLDPRDRRRGVRVDRPRRARPAPASSPSPATSSTEATTSFRTAIRCAT